MPAPIATQNHTRKGLVKGEPRRFISGHYSRTPEARERASEHARAARAAHSRNRRARWTASMEDCGYETPCHVWQGHVNRGGYGVLADRIRHQYAHRWIYERDVGPILDGMHLHHRCGVRSCVNVDHLELLTPSAHAALHAAERKPTAA
jgi:HNH endonuclease